MTLGSKRISEGITHHSFSSFEQAMQFYEVLLEQLELDFAIVDDQKRILCVSQLALPEHLQKKDVVGRDLFEVFPHLVPYEFPQIVDRVIAAGKPYIERYVRHRTARGYSGIFHRKFIPVNIEGACKAVIVSIEDVSQQRTAELHAQESEMRYQRLIENMNLVSFRLDASGRFLFMNNAAYGIFEWSPTEMLGTSFVQYVHPEDTASLWRVFWQVVNHGQPYGTVQNRIVTRTGTIKHMRWFIHPLYDEEGKIIGSQGVGEDVTESETFVEVLRESYGKYKGFFNALPVPVMLIDAQDHIVGVNRGLSKLLGYTDKEMRNLLIFDILPANQLEAASRMWQQFKQKGGMPRQPAVFLRKDRTEVFVLVNGVRFGNYFMLIAERNAKR